AQLGAVALLDSGEERVEVHVQDRPVGHGRYHRPAVEPPARKATAPLSARTGLALALGIVLAGLVAWAVPITSIVLIWPILFAIPGWVVVKRVAPDLSAPGVVGVAIVTSTYVSAHVVDVVARAMGFGRPAIVISAVGLGLAAV